MSNSLKIVSLNKPSIFGLDENILNIGDQVIEVNGNKTSDQLDFYFFLPENEKAQLRIKRKSGNTSDISLEASVLSALDIRFSPMSFKRCKCKCPFCFVDQMPKGLRSSLYVKDEDFRLSFLYGNFTTMNDITDEEIKKIITQNLQPQYVSVHAVESEVREKIFGRPMKRNIITTLKTLASSGITVHAQIVLCPGINDGEHLKNAIEELESLDLNIQSLSVVPVGLTRHRQKLPAIRQFTGSEMEAIIDLIENYQASYLDSPRKSRFVFASDEWYIEGRRSLPAFDCYESFPQIDNGVGMTRDFLYEIEKDLEDCLLPEKMGDIGIITGTLGSSVFYDYVFPIFSAANVKELPSVIQVKNGLFGDCVTVSGLIPAHDILDRIKTVQEESCFLLPPNCLNYEGKFIDGPDIDYVRRETSRNVVAAGSSLIRSMAACTDGEG